MEVPNTNQKGRNAELIMNRNQKLAARFYFYSCIIGLKFSKCLENLIPEFDISESRICDLLSENADVISTMENKEVTLQQLKSSYPFLNWQYFPNRTTRQTSLFK